MLSANTFLILEAPFLFVGHQFTSTEHMIHFDPIVVRSPQREHEMKSVHDLAKPLAVVAADARIMSQWVSVPTLHIQRTPRQAGLVPLECYK